MEEESPYQTLSSKKVWENRWYWLQLDEVRFPDGSIGSYTTVKRGRAVFIIPVLSDGRIALIRHYRYTVGSWLWEVPAGGVDEGMTPEVAAMKELSEEIGGRAEAFVKIASFFSMPGISDEISDVFIARGVTLGEPHREASEVMETHLFSPNAIEMMLQRGEITDGPSALAIFLSLPVVKNK